MNFEKMKVEELKKYLDKHEVDYSEAKVKGDYVQLAEIENARKAKKAMQSESDVQEDIATIEDLTEGTEKTTSLADKVKSAIKIERTETKKVNDASYLKDRDYSQLTVGERAIIREQSPEYINDDNGVNVTVTDRLPTKWRIVKRSDKSYSKLIKGATYVLSQADFAALKNEKVKVKTEETKNKCCGQATYESVNLLEVIDD